MLEIAPRSHITIAYTTTSSPQDAGLLRIQEYLQQRYVERERQGQRIANREILIDIGCIGLCNIENDSGARIWEQQVIYPIRVYHSTVLLGPVYQPTDGAGPCPLCLERRWQAQRMQEGQEALYDLEKVLVFGQNPRLTPFALEFIWEVTEMMVDASLPSVRLRQNEGSIYNLDLNTFQVERHTLIQDPLCPLCMPTELDPPEAAMLQLSSRTKREPNIYHAFKAEEYDFPIDGYVNSVCGMLAANAYYDRQHTITSPVSGIFLMKGRYGMHKGWWGGHGNSYRSSYYLGLLEGLERYSGFRPRTKKEAIFASYEHLAPNALYPPDCGLYQSAFYEATYPMFTAFRPDLKTHWIWGYSLRNQRSLLVPEQMVYYLNYRTEPSANTFILDNSNGCATGSSIEEAILHGLLELFERDSFLISWYAKLSPPRIDPWSSRNPQTLSILDRIDRLGYDIHLLDMRLDIPIPAIVAIAVRREDKLGKLVLAAGASLDPEDAIRAALCEVGAYIPSFVERVEKNMDELILMEQDYSRVTTIEQHPLLYGLPEMAVHAQFLFQNPTVLSVETAYEQWRKEMPHSLNLLDDLQYCIDLMLVRDLDVIVVDQTSPPQREVGLRTACVIVPGLMPMEFGFYRDRVRELPRLRTVPRTAGFLEKDFDPALLNLTPHPFP